VWIRGKRVRNRWGDWEWSPRLTIEQLREAREAVQTRWIAYVRACLARGEHLFVGDKQYPSIKTPLGFTPNDFVRTTVEPLGIKVDFFNIRQFFQTIEVSAGTFDQGPVEPHVRLANVLTEPDGGW